MKITKLGHSCLLVEMPDRTALFDPGSFSDINVESLKYLDDIIITHRHQDHMDETVLTGLFEKFPDVRVTAPAEIVAKLGRGSSEGSEGIVLFDSPHEGVAPLFDPPEEIGVHYLDKLSHPGDSHSFSETCPILALPVTAPWGSTTTATNLALELKPQYIVPIHDWHWRDEARDAMYDRLETVFSDAGITFIKAVNGRSFNLEV